MYHALDKCCWRINHISIEHNLLSTVTEFRHVVLFKVAVFVAFPTCQWTNSCIFHDYIFDIKMLFVCDKHYLNDFRASKLCYNLIYMVKCHKHALKILQHEILGDHFVHVASQHYNVTSYLIGWAHITKWSMNLDIGGGTMNIIPITTHSKSKWIILIDVLFSSKL